MKEASNSTTIFSRHPLSTLGKLSVTALLGGALSSGGLALLIGLPDNVPLLITTAALLLVAGLVALGLRWIPLVGTLLKRTTCCIVGGGPAGAMLALLLAVSNRLASLAVLRSKIATSKWLNFINRESKPLTWPLGLG